MHTPRGEYVPEDQSNSIKKNNNRTKKKKKEKKPTEPTQGST